MIEIKECPKCKADLSALYHLEWIKPRGFLWWREAGYLKSRCRICGYEWEVSK